MHACTQHPLHQLPCTHRLFLSAEPPPLLERALPISLLQNSIKLTNEPPEGLKANLKRAYSNFNEEILESCAKQAEYRTIVFALSYFHAALLERKKFGVGNLPGATSGIGWNMNYPFNTGDLLCCCQTANNYLENNSKVGRQHREFPDRYMRGVGFDAEAMLAVEALSVCPA